jgi:haloalkane dehalogenase
MDLLRTPDDRFENLPDWPFAPRYVEVDSLRIHYVDEGPREGKPVLLLHGEPSWSYLYRHMIPPLVAAGHRVLAPDLVGFGRSDKPTLVEAYSYARHVAWMAGWLLKLDLKGLTLFAQDWGGLIGLRLYTELPERFERAVVSNTGLPIGKSMGPAFGAWRAFALRVKELPIAGIIQGGTRRKLTRDERRAYKAPFPTEAYKVAARVFPLLVPTDPEHEAVPDNLRAWEVLGRSEKPFLTAFSDGDPITRGADKGLQKRIPGAAGQAHVTVKGGHFVQEDSGPELAQIIHTFIG